MSDPNSRTLFVVLGLVGGLFFMGILAAIAVVFGAYFYASTSSSLPPTRAVRASAPVEVESMPVMQPDEIPVVAPIPTTAQ